MSSQNLSLHKSDRLEGLLGKKVKIKFWDNDIRFGILDKSKYHPDYYLLDNVEFRKSHVKKILGVY